MADDNTEFNLKAFGLPINIKGIGSIIVIVLLLLTAGLAWMLYDLSHSAALAVKEALTVQKTVVIEHKAIMDAAVVISESQSALMDDVKTVGSSVKTQNWILLADPAEKADVKRRLSIPKELRELGVRER